MSRCRVERPLHFRIAVCHHCVIFASETVSSTGVWLPSVLSRKDSERMVMISFVAGLKLICCDCIVVKANLFALCHIHIAALMRCTSSREMFINVVARALEECCCPRPWSFQRSVCIGVAAPVVEYCKVDVIVICTTCQSH